MKINLILGVEKRKYTIKQTTKALAMALELLAMALVVYLVAAPLYPSLSYDLYDKWQAVSASPAEAIDKYANQLPENRYRNRIIIKKIGVNAPIIRTIDANYALSRGAWMSPDQAYPGDRGNVVISGHRFKYLPPNNLTFYLLDKLKAGDMVSIFWNYKVYNYKVKESKVILPTDVSILASTGKPTLTLYTCTPIFSEKKRLAVVAELTGIKD